MPDRGRAASCATRTEHLSVWEFGSFKKESPDEGD